MFLVINKEKLSSYIISISTVVILFIITGIVNPHDKVVETSVNIQKEINTNSTNIRENDENNNTSNL